MRSNKKELVLKGLGCANCALKIENRINKLEGVEKAYLNFASGKLTIKYYDASRLDSIIKMAKEIIKSIEPDVRVVEEDKQNPKEYYTMKDSLKNEGIFIVPGLLILIVASIFEFSLPIEFSLYFTSYLLIGKKVLLKAFKNIINKQFFDENFLMSIATIGAFFIKEFPEAVAVMLFYQIGELFQNLAVNNSKKSIKALVNIRPDYANLKNNTEITRVSPEKVNVGDTIIVKPGEKIPLDGIIVEGKSSVDTSTLTGESIPRKITTGDEVLSGFINIEGVLTVKVTKPFEESAAQKIIELVENASSKKAPTEKFITKFSKYYTPIIVLISFGIAVIPPLLIQGANFSDWLYKALIFLVVSCPCALVLSVPLGFFGGIGCASRNGILVKGGNFLEALDNIDTIVFDKTGTLTKGVFKVSKIEARNGFSKDEILKYAAIAESYSNHPIALSILKEYSNEINKDKIKEYTEIAGHGVSVSFENKNILVGNDKLMDKENISYESTDNLGTTVHISIDKKYAGYIVVSDEVKSDSKNTIRKLKELGIKKSVLLTGDNKTAAIKTAEKLGIDEVYYELLPDGKVDKIESLANQRLSKGKIVFVGDGINDAPVIARADVGIAMGGLGSDAAIEAADVVIMNDEPSRIVTAVKIARRTKKIVWQNIILALSVKFIVLLLGSLQMASMWEAVFADVGVAVLAVFNSLRVLKMNDLTEMRNL
jgi:Cd2+/Zn2+-exporting ATPase